MDETALAEMFYKDGDFIKACKIYDFKLLSEDFGSLNILLAQACCQMSHDHWNDCFESILKAFQGDNWHSCFLENFIENLITKFRRRSETFAIPKGQTECYLLEENLICQCCNTVLCVPITLSQCGHTYCRTCILKVNKCLFCSVDHKCGEKLQYKAANIILTNIIEKCFPNKEKALKLRCEGNDYVSQKKFDDSLKKYTEALNLDPSNHFILGNISHVHSMLEDYVSALDFAERACKILPNWDKGIYRKAQACVGLKNYPQAAVEYITVLSLQPQNDIARQGLFKVLIEILTSCCEGSRSMIDKLILSLEHFATNCEDRKDNFTGPVEHVQSVLSEKIDATDLECPLCCRMFYNPITCSCGHTFCQWCLNRCLDHNPVCPVCRHAINDYIQIENQNITRSINAVCKKYFPEQFEKRKVQHEDEGKKLANVACDTNEDIPIFVCTLALPTIPCALCIFEPRYRLMIRECMESGSKQFGMCCPSDNGSFSDYGVMLEVEDFTLLPDGKSLVKTVGGRRFEVLSRGMEHGYNTAKVKWLKDEAIPVEETETIRQRQQTVYTSIITWFSSLDMFTKIRLFSEMRVPTPPECDSENIKDRNGPKWMWWTLNILPIETSTKLEIVSMTDIRERLYKIEQFVSENIS